MSPDVQRSLGASFLVPPLGWPWEWSEDGEAVIWQDGATVAMREELSVLIERLIPHGVPHPGPLMLLLAACRGKVADEVAVVELFRGSATPSASPLAGRRLLEELAKLPRELLAGVPSKASLATLVFAAAPKLKSSESAAVLALLREGLPPSAWPISMTEARARDLLAELRVLHEGLAPLDMASIEHALRTGVPEPPNAAEIELPLGERVAALLKEVENDPEFPGLASLARDVMAAVTLPRALPQPDHDSPGGFADIGNKGQLHRLLLSELAHDDDTLAARIALGEALYLRREPAAKPPPATLALLLDAGLRMWGTPRIFGTAVALACLAKAPVSQGAVAFRANGSKAEPLALATRANLAAHLATLDTTLNPSAALAPLASQLKVTDEQLDVIVITHRLALEDSEFNTACAAQCGMSVHAATVDRDGAFALHLRTPGGWQPLAEARLNLDALFTVPARRALPRDTELPAMLRDNRDIFRLPISGKLRAACAVRAAGMPAALVRTIGITDDGSLWGWCDSKKHGARRFPATRLRGSFCELVYDRAAGCAIAVGHETQGNRINFVRRFDRSPDRETHMTELAKPMTRLARVFTFGGHLFLGTARQITVINIESGAIVGEAPLLSGVHWLLGRFLARYTPNGRAFMAVTFDGTQVVFEPLTQRWLREHSARVLYLFEREGMEGIWALDQNGRFFDAETGSLFFDSQIGALSEARVSRDGHRFWMRNTRRGCMTVDLIAQRTAQSYEGGAELDMLPSPRPWSLRSKFTHIGLALTGHVWLRAQKGYWLEIRMKEQSRTFALEPKPQGAAPEFSIEFDRPKAVHDYGCTISVAALPGGSLAWLDSRGMLHLRAADLFLPELTIVLAESTSLPVWSSDNVVVGPEYFTAGTNQRPGSAEKLAVYLRSFVASCR